MRSPGKEQKSPEKTGRGDAEWKTGPGICRTRESKLSVAPTPLMPTQKCVHRVSTLWPLGNTSWVPAWLPMSSPSVNSSPAYLPGPHRSGSWAATTFLCDSILWLNSLCRDLELKHSQGLSEDSWDCVSISPGLWVPHSVLGKAAKTYVQKREQNR